MRLETLIMNSGYQDTRGDLTAEIVDLVMDSRKVSQGSLFICISGTRIDGHAFAEQAVERGASALIVERFLDELNVPQIRYEDTRSAMALLAANWWGNPAQNMRFWGITGTKGKTTTSYMLKSILETAGRKVGLFGTIATVIGDEEIPQGMTTPDPLDFHMLLRKMADAGCTDVVMEVSAHALALRKLEGICYDCSSFTNFSQDHLDDFKTMENYLNAKKILFQEKNTRKAAINMDDPRVMEAVKDYPGPVLTYGNSEQADLRAEKVRMTAESISFTLICHGFSTDIKLKLSGFFNVYNAMAATAMALQMGYGMNVIKVGLENLERMNGRMELVKTGLPFATIVDYAHSPDSLENLLNSARELPHNRIVLVFGCGGDRDRTKRPIMGKIAMDGADYVIVTSDNPRTEKPDSIIEMIVEGMKDSQTPYECIPTREEAILRGMQVAGAGDILLIAGKGHETYQDVMGEKRHFDDREWVTQYVGQIQG